MHNTSLYTESNFRCYLFSFGFGNERKIKADSDPTRVADPAVYITWHSALPSLLDYSSGSRPHHLPDRYRDDEWLPLAVPHAHLLSPESYRTVITNWAK